jgi:peptide/nickel transport system ATP-binding protein
MATRSEVPTRVTAEAGRLAAHGVAVRYPGFTAVEDVSFEVPPGQFVAVVGPTGCGKSTLLNLVAGLQAASAGRVSTGGRPVAGVNRDCAYMFQMDALLPWRSALQNVRLGPQLRGMSRSEADKLAREWLARVGLSGLEDRYPHQLSGGQRQRVMVARALLLKPKLIIADEPVSMVDASLRATILATLRALNRDFGISLIYITHDLTTAYQVAENMIVLYRGSVAEVGDVKLVVKQPQHPYTQLLVGSIPLPDPAHAWRAEEVQAGIPGARAARACRFAERCPHAMPMCVETPPPLFRTARHRAASCYLYRDAPVLDRREMDEVLVQPGVPA